MWSNELVTLYEVLLFPLVWQKEDCSDRGVQKSLQLITQCDEKVPSVHVAQQRLTRMTEMYSQVFKHKKVLGSTAWEALKGKKTICSQIFFALKEENKYDVA